MLGGIQERAWAGLGGMRELQRLWQGWKHKLQRMQGIRLDVDEVTCAAMPIAAVSAKAGSNAGYPSEITWWGPLPQVTVRESPA